MPTRFLSATIIDRFPIPTVNSHMSQSVRPAFYLSLATYEGIKVGPIKHRQIMPTEEYGRPRPGFKGNLCGAHKSPVLASLTQNHQNVCQVYACIRIL